MKKVIWYLIIVIVSVSISCKKNSVIPNNIIVVGFLQKTGIVTYGYGTHFLTKDNIQKEHIYALTSTNINLDNFSDQQVRLTGKKKTG